MNTTYDVSNPGARSRRRISAALPGIFLLFLAAIGPGRAPAADLSRAGSPPRLVRIAGSVPAALARARLIGQGGALRREADDPLTVTLVLKRDRPQAFARYLRSVYRWGSPQYHHFLTQRQIADRFGPSRTDYARTLAYLRGVGFTLLRGSVNRLTLTVRGTRAMAERAFHVDIRDYRLGNRRFHANSTDPALPAAIAPHVQAIVGLDDLARPWHVGAGEVNQVIWNHLPSEAQFLIQCYSPAMAEAIQNLDIPDPGLFDAIEAVTAPVACELNMIAAASASYGAFPDPTPGSGQTIGLLEFDNYHPSDVQNYLDLMGVGSRFNQLSEANVGQGAGAPGSGEAEVLLDIDIAMQLAPGANVVVYDGRFSGAGSFQAMFNAMINSGVTVISDSWATCENQDPPADVQSLNSILANAAAAGITVVAGTGDDGSTCLDGAANTVAVPADSPNVTAVGGTTATATVAGAYQSEQWWDGATHTPPTGQGGFGVSRIFPVPSYQTSFTSAAGRSVPDVSAPADPAGGWTICEADQGGCPAPLLFGGTSAAAPIWASIVAVLNQELGHNLGFLNPTLYSLAGSSAFHSAASMGSDFAHVGLGTPNVNELRRLLAGGTTGSVDLAHCGIVVPPVPIVADGRSAAPVSVTTLDSNFYTVSGQAVTLSANSGSHAVITPVRGTTDLASGAALFDVTDTVPETVTLTASTAAGTLPATATVTFVSPPAAAGGISASPTTVTADGASSTDITVTLKDANGNPSPNKVVGLAQGNGGSQISAATATTDSTGTVNFTATDNLAQTVTYTATDITDGNLPVPGSAQVQFTNAPAAPPCSVGLGTAAAGYAVSTFASGFVYYSGDCIGPIGLAFDPQGNLLVGNQYTGGLYRFGPQGGSADPGHLLGYPLGGGMTGLAFGKDGSLYADWRPVCANYVLAQIDPATDQVIRDLNSPECPTGLAVDPLSGDLFVSGIGGIYRISNLATGAGTVTLYSSVGADGITFAPDGTLYGSGAGVVYSITGTNSPTPGVATTIASVPGADGITLGVNPGNASLPYVFVNSNDGDIVKIDQTTSPATVTTIYSGGSRGDFVTVGPDGCMYATQTDRVIKITNADGTCSFEPIAVAPAIALQPTALPSNPTQGSTVTLTAQLQNVPNPANVPVHLVVTGANPWIYAGSSDANGRVSFTLTGVESGVDQARAVFSPNGTALVSNVVNVQWLPGAHSTFIGLNESPTLGAIGIPTTLTATLLDVSANPQTPLASQTLNFSLDGQSCSATTDGAGTASCTVTPTTAGVATLNASFGGGSRYVPSATDRRFDVTTAVVTTAAPTVSVTVSPTAIAVGSSATLSWSSANATACTASGAWSGSQALSGNQTVSPAAAGTDTYTLTCTGADGTASASAVLAATLVSVTISAHSGGGGALSIPVLALLGGLLALRWLARRATGGARRSVLMLILLVAGGSNGAAHASSSALLDRLYLGVRVGAMPLSMDAGRIDGALATHGFASVTARQQTGGAAETIYLGVQLSRHNALEIAYTNRESRVASLAGTIGSVTELPALLRETARSLRGYGNIFSASYCARIRLLSRFYLDPRVGGFYWSTRERVEGGGASFTLQHRGAGLTAGLGLSYRLWRRLYAGIGLDYFRGFPANEAMLYAGSLEWRFGRTH